MNIKKANEILKKSLEDLSLESVQEIFKYLTRDDVNLIDLEEGFSLGCYKSQAISADNEVIEIVLTYHIVDEDFCTHPIATDVFTPLTESLDDRINRILQGLYTEIGADVWKSIRSDNRYLFIEG